MRSPKKAFALALALALCLAPLPATAAETNSDNPYSHLRAEDIAEIRMEESHYIPPALVDSVEDIAAIVGLLHSIPYRPRVEGDPEIEGLQGYVTLTVKDSRGKESIFGLPDFWEYNNVYPVDHDQYAQAREEIRKICRDNTHLLPLLEARFGFGELDYLRVTDGIRSSKYLTDLNKLLALEDFLCSAGPLHYLPSFSRRDLVTILLVDGTTYCLYRDGRDYALYYNEHFYTVNRSWAEEAASLYGRLDAPITSPVPERWYNYALPPLTGKPVIYLYPQQPTLVQVQVDFQGEFTQTIPHYNGSWTVLARPNGTLTDLRDGADYPYLFWEGITPHRWRFDQGFVVKGGETEAFLADALNQLSLLPHESAEFLEYWVPQMRNNPYNLVTFSPIEEYGAVAKLSISPQPDSLLRIHMAWKALDEPVDIPPQTLAPFQRRGFTVVEWGGTQSLG